MKNDSSLLEGNYLTKSEVEEFQKLIKEVYNLDLTYPEAEDQGTKLIQLFELMKRFEPIPMSYKDVIDEKQERDNI